MTARSLGDVLKGVTPKKNRTFQPVRRNSYHRGDRENRVWRPFDKKRKGAIMRAAEAFDRKHKQPGKRNGPLGHIGIEVMRRMLQIVDHRSGRLEPSIDYLMRSTGRCRDAIVQALKRLKAHGFIDWIRRTEPTGIEDGSGPRVKQIPNAYWIKMPKVVADAVERMMGGAPVPADAQHHTQEAAAEFKAMIASLPLDELPHAIVEDQSLAAILSRLGAGIASRDSSASLPSSLNPA